MHFIFHICRLLEKKKEVLLVLLKLETNIHPEAKSY